MLRWEKNFNQYKKAYFEYNYDIENKYYKYILLGAKLNKKCWQYDFSIQKDRIPVLKEEGISYTNNYMLRFNINFNPIGGLKQTIQLK
jgi:LPS-assembly protein